MFTFHHRCSRTVISPDVVGDGGMAEFLQTNALPAVRFYRVRVAD